MSKIISEQKDALCSLFRKSLEKLDLNKEEAQQIIEVGGKMQEELESILENLAMGDGRFGWPIEKFEFTIPIDYEHDSQLDTFVAKTKSLESTLYLDNGLTSLNFSKATNKLLPGKTYQVKIFPILFGPRVDSAYCLEFLEKQKAILVGGQGITLLQAITPDKFRSGWRILSFDQKSALWIDPYGYRKVPCVVNESDKYRFILCDFNLQFGSDFCVLCFCEL